MIHFRPDPVEGGLPEARLLYPLDDRTVGRAQGVALEDAPVLQGEEDLAVTLLEGGAAGVEMQRVRAPSAEPTRDAATPSNAPTATNSCCGAPLCDDRYRKRSYGVSGAK